MRHRWRNRSHGSNQGKSLSRRSGTSSPPTVAPGPGGRRPRVNVAPARDPGLTAWGAAFRSAWAHNAQVTNEQGPAFQPLTGIFEPSAIQQLPDGRFLVVEDEKSHPLSLVTIGADGSVDSTALTAGLFQIFSGFWKLEDLEDWLSTARALSTASHRTRAMTMATRRSPAKSWSVSGSRASGWSTPRLSTD